MCYVQCVCVCVCSCVCVSTKELGHLVLFQRRVEECVFKRAFHCWNCTLSAVYVTVYCNFCFARGTKVWFRIAELFGNQVTIDISLAEQLLFCHSQGNAGCGVMFY